MIPNDPRDAMLLAQCPVEGVPRFGALAALERPGQRMLLASNGVFIEVRTPALHAIQRAGELGAGLVLPYGAVDPTLSFAFGKLPLVLIERFLDAARAAFPDELAGALTYHPETGVVALALHEGEASPASVRYRIARQEPETVLVLDMHSHGAHGAYFSAEDDRDDVGIKVSAVFGRLDLPRPSAAFRLCLNGLFVPLPHRWA